MNQVCELGDGLARAGQTREGQAVKGEGRMSLSLLSVGACFQVETSWWHLEDHTCARCGQAQKVTFVYSGTACFPKGGKGV